MTPDEAARWADEEIRRERIRALVDELTVLLSQEFKSAGKDVDIRKALFVPVSVYKPTPV